jgi:hypothetical protein
MVSAVSSHRPYFDVIREPGPELLLQGTLRIGEQPPAQGLVLEAPFDQPPLYLGAIAATGSCYKHEDVD